MTLSQSFVLVVPQMTGELVRLWQSVGSRQRQRLDTGFLVIRDRHHRWFSQCAFQQASVDDLDLLVNMQDLDHLPFKLRIPALDVIADLVGPDLALRQYPMQFGTTQFDQAGVSGIDAMLAHVLLQ